jgi:putative tricarboxylic transport membrane protein
MSNYRTHNSRLLACVATAGLSVLASVPVAAQEKFPSKPIQIVTHASAGGGTDTTVRMAIPDAQDALGSNMFVATMKGGGGRVAMNFAKLQGTDGHTLMLITPTHLFTMAQGNSPLSIDDIVGVARATDDPMLIVTSPGSRFKSIDDLIGAGKDKPVKWGTTHIGGVDHVAAESFAQKAGTKIRAVPFEGGGELVTNLMGGNVEVASLNVTEALEQVRHGDLVPLAAMSDERIDVLPDLPTTQEKGVDVVFSTVRGFVVLKGVPEERVAILEKGLLDAMKQDRFQAYLENGGMPKKSVAGRAAWDAQIRRMYADASVMLQSLGLVKK